MLLLFSIFILFSISFGVSFKFEKIEFWAEGTFISDKLFIPN